jgi:penicillin-binding protein 2
VSLPDYDPNDFASGLDPEEYDKLIYNKAEPLFNRAIGGMYPSGSIIKPFLASAALHEDIIASTTFLYTDGSISVPSKYDPSVIYTFNDWKNHGSVNMREAIAVSSNVYFYIIGGGYKGREGLGIERIKEYLSIFGWGKKTSIDLYGEADGFLPDPEWKRRERGEEWYIGDTYQASIGQGNLLATPLQVAASIASVANSGTLFVPHVVARIGDDPYIPESKSLPFSSHTLRVVQEGMRNAVLEGSSQILRDLPIAVAGKTGTAETGGEDTHAWFAGFAPYENPELVIVVMMEDGGRATEAVYVARDILNIYYSK